MLVQNCLLMYLHNLLTLRQYHVLAVSTHLTPDWRNVINFSHHTPHMHVHTVTAQRRDARPGDGRSEQCATAPPLGIVGYLGL